MKFAYEMAILLGRIVTILPLMLFFTIFMGRRSIGELPIFDFLVIITLASVVGADIADPSVEHIHTAVAVIAIALFHRLIIYLKLKYRKFGRLTTFEPIIVIKDGVLLKNQLKQINYTIDNLLLLLREKDVFDIAEVKLGIIEANGNLSIFKYSQKETVKKEDLNITMKSDTFHFPLIIEGNVYNQVLKELDLSNDWLSLQLKAKGISHENEVFFASINKKKELTISLYEESNGQIPPLYH